PDRGEIFVDDDGHVARLGLLRQCLGGSLLLELTCLLRVADAKREQRQGQQGKPDPPKPVAQASHGQSSTVTKRAVGRICCHLLARLSEGSVAPTLGVNPRRSTEPR